MSNRVDVSQLNEWIMKCNQLSEENERLKKENAELRRLNELYYNNSVSQEEEHSCIIKEVASLQSELSDCEEVVTHISTYISDLEKFLSFR